MESPSSDEPPHRPAVIGLLESIAAVLRQEGVECETRAAAIEEFLAARGLGHLAETTVALQHFDFLRQLLDNIAAALSSLAARARAEPVSLSSADPDIVRRALEAVVLTELRNRLTRADARAEAGHPLDKQIEIWDDPEI